MKAKHKALDIASLFNNVGNESMGDLGSEG